MIRAAIVGLGHHGFRHIEAVKNLEEITRFKKIYIRSCNFCDFVCLTKKEFITQSPMESVMITSGRIITTI